MYTIIIAGSLATLRPLLQKATSTYTSFRFRGSKGYLSHSYEQPHRLRAYPRRSTDASTLRITGPTAVESSEHAIPTRDVKGIVKTVDINIADSVASGKPKRSEYWEDYDDIEQGGTKEIERI